MYLFFLTVLMWSLQRWVASEAEADLSHRRSALQTQQGAVQHEEGDAGAQQGELSFYNCIFKTVKSKNKRDVRKRSPLIFLNRSLLIGMQTHADHTRKGCNQTQKIKPVLKKRRFSEVQREVVLHFKRANIFRWNKTDLDIRTFHKTATVLFVF